MADSNGHVALQPYITEGPSKHCIRLYEVRERFVVTENKPNIKSRYGKITMFASAIRERIALQWN